MRQGCALVPYARSAPPRISTTPTYPVPQFSFLRNPLILRFKQIGANEVLTWRALNRCWHVFGARQVDFSAIWNQIWLIRILVCVFRVAFQRVVVVSAWWYFCLNLKQPCPEALRRRA